MKLISARATIHLKGLQPGQVVLVDPDDEYVNECFASAALVPEPAPAKEKE